MVKFTEVFPPTEMLGGIPALKVLIYTTMGEIIKSTKCHEMKFYRKKHEDCSESPFIRNLPQFSRCIVECSPLFSNH